MDYGILFRWLGKSVWNFECANFFKYLKKCWIGNGMQFILGVCLAHTKRKMCAVGLAFYHFFCALCFYVVFMQLGRFLINKAKKLLAKIIIIIFHRKIQFQFGSGWNEVTQTMHALFPWIWSIRSHTHKPNWMLVLAFQLQANFEPEQEQQRGIPFSPLPCLYFLFLCFDAICRAPTKFELIERKKKVNTKTQKCI